MTIEFVCPACKGALASDETKYRCSRCARTFPVIFGIADFRLRSDRYLTLESDRAKARRLHEFGLTSSFDDLVAYYYSITDDVPGELAVRYRAYIQAATARGARILSELPSAAPSTSLVDLGCGTGGLLVAAASRFRGTIGVDIALRWLVICAKRLAEEGVDVPLVCADVEALPFPLESFTHAVAADLLENVYDPGNAVAEMTRHLNPGGTLWLSGTNKYTLGPHPLVHLWGIGFLPKPLRAKVVEAFRGHDSLRNVNLVSPAALVRLCRAKGLEVIDLKPARVETASLDAYPRFDRILMELYSAMIGVRLLRGLLILIGPGFEIICRKAAQRRDAMSGRAQR